MALDPTARRYSNRIPPDEPGGGRSAGKPADMPDPSVSDDDGHYLLCSQCRHIITRPSERIAVNGAHRHTFANPHGIVYEIGCFRNAVGCGHTGPATDDFTWFNGYAWRVAICSRCLGHMGWLFVSGGGEQFYGLILDRLIETE
jgi:hypothetical protein